MRMYVYAEYTKLFGENIENEYKNILNKVDKEKAFKILSRFGYYSRNTDREIVNKIFFKSFPRKNIAKYRRYLTEQDLITRHGVLLATKTLLKHIDSMQPSNHTMQTQLGDMFKLILIMHEVYMREKEDTPMEEYILANSVYNYYDNLANQSARAYYIFVKRHEEVQEENVCFIKRYGISIEEYIYLTTIVNAFMNNTYRKYCKDDTLYKKEWEFEVEAFPSFLEKEKDTLYKYLESVSFLMSQPQVEDIDIFLKKYPIMKLNDTSYIPIEKKLCDELVFDSLVYKISECCEGPEFLNKFGLLFQNYVAYICDEFCQKSRGRYQYIGEFSYGKPLSNSPDIMIIEKTKARKAVLVIEVKALKLKHKIDDYMNVADKDIEEGIERSIVRPYKQAVTSMENIVRASINEELNSSAAYYFLSVTRRNFPQKMDCMDRMREVKSSSNVIEICDYNSICIEELELLLQVLEDNKKISFVDIFELFRQDKTGSLKNILKQFSMQKDRRNVELFCNDYLYAKFKEHINYDIVTSLSDECTRRACKKYIMK